MDKYELIDFLRNNLTIECDKEYKQHPSFAGYEFRPHLAVKLILNVDDEPIEISKGSIDIINFTKK